MKSCLLNANKARGFFLHVGVISFFVTKKCQKIRKIDENSLYWRRKYLHVLNDLKNFSEIFRRNVTCHNIKVHKKAELHQVSERCIFEKTTQRWVKLTPSFSFFGKKPEKCRFIHSHLNEKSRFNLEQLWAKSETTILLS